MSLKAAAKEARKSSAALAAHGASTSTSNMVDNAESTGNFFSMPMAALPLEKEGGSWFQRRTTALMRLVQAVENDPMYRGGS